MHKISVCYLKFERRTKSTENYKGSDHSSHDRAMDYGTHDAPDALGSIEIY